MLGSPPNSKPKAYTIQIHKSGSGRNITITVLDSKGKIWNKKGGWGEVGKKYPEFIDKRPFVGVRLLPPIENIMFKAKTYRLVANYMVRARYQGGPTSGVKDNLVFFSPDESSIKKLGNFLSKYTKNVKTEKR